MAFIGSYYYIPGTIILFLCLLLYALFVEQSSLCIISFYSSFCSFVYCNVIVSGHLPVHWLAVWHGLLALLIGPFLLFYLIIAVNSWG
jgi:hypothetical protein